MFEAMNSTVMNGTPRTNSMRMTEKSFTAGIFERRPSASRMPQGSEKTMPTKATISEISTPPQRFVGTGLRPASSPVTPTKRPKATATPRIVIKAVRKSASV